MAIQSACDLRDAILKRTGMTREELKCPREKSLMTPCIARDGNTAVTTNSVCVGCGVSLKDMIEKEEARARRPA